MKDPVIEELHRIRRENCEKHGFDLKAIVADIRKRSQQRKLATVDHGKHRSTRVA